MARLSPAPFDQYSAAFGVDAPMRHQIYALSPGIAKKFLEVGQALRDEHTLAPRLIELVRLRMAFHNQCRSCMAARYDYAVQDGLSEELVCSLEKPHEADDLTDPERAALTYADLMATNHLAINDDTFAALKEHFTDAEIMELCFNVAFFVGIGRMTMALDITDGLPEGYLRSGVVTPWNQDELQHLA